MWRCIVTVQHKSITTIKWVRATLPPVQHSIPAMVPDLPLDVWLQIVHLIPEGELDRLLSLNSLFFHTVMKNRYRRVRISNSPKEAKRNMALLRRLSYVAKIFRLGGIYITSTLLLVTHLLAVSSKALVFASNFCLALLALALPTPP